MVQRMTTQNFNSSAQKYFYCQLKSKRQMLQNSENPVLPINKVSHSVYAHKHYKTQSTLQKWKIYAMLFTLFQLFAI